MKQRSSVLGLLSRRVAPRAGAWIETVPTGNAWPAVRESPPARGRGLKLLGSELSPFSFRRPPRGGVD